MHGWHDGPWVDSGIRRGGGRTPTPPNSKAISTHRLKAWQVSCQRFFAVLDANHFGVAPLAFSQYKLLGLHRRLDFDEHAGRRNKRLGRTKFLKKWPQCAETEGREDEPCSSRAQSAKCVTTSLSSRARMHIASVPASRSNGARSAQASANCRQGICESPKHKQSTVRQISFKNGSVRLLPTSCQRQALLFTCLTPK